MRMIILKSFTLRRIPLILLCRGGGSLEDALNSKQGKTDSNLDTTSKTVVGAINEINTDKADKDLGSPDNTQLTATLTSTNDEKNAVPVHWSPTNGLLFVWKDGIRYYLVSTSDVKDNLNTTNALYPLSAKQGYIMSRDVPWYGTSSTSASTTAKIATTSDTEFALVTGAKVTIKFTYDNTASAPTLNVDSTGAKTIKGYGSTIPSNWWKAGDIVTFVYNGTYWIMQPSQGQITQLSNMASYKNNGSHVDISNYNTSSNKYTVTKDGYIWISVTFHVYSSRARCSVYVNDSIVFWRDFSSKVTSESQVANIFVGKGSTVYYETDGEGATAGLTINYLQIKFIE